MPEYIEREALLAELEDEIDFVSPFYNAEQNQYFTMGLRCAYRDAQRFPAAADVVEVVRCKDCKYWQDNNDGYPHQECRWGNYETPDPDDYCSYGELKDGDTE